MQQHNIKLDHLLRKKQQMKHQFNYPKLVKKTLLLLWLHQLQHQNQQLFKLQLKKWKQLEIQSKRVLKMKKMQNARDTDTILAGIFNVIESLTREKSNDQEALQETIRNRDIQDKRSRHTEFNAAKNGNQQRNQQCQVYELQYQQNTIERDKQIAIIRDVQNIIATKMEVVTCFVVENNLF